MFEKKLPNNNFAVGNIPANPPPVWQSYGARLKSLSNLYTSDEILIKASSPFERSKLSAFDAIAILHLARAIDPELTKLASGSDDVRAERKDLLDRIEGQTKATTEITGKDGSAITPLIKIVFEGNNSNVLEASSEVQGTVLENQAQLDTATEESLPATAFVPKIEFE